VTTWKIQRIDVIDVTGQAPRGAVDVMFTAVRTSEGTGWYGPVTQQIGRRVIDLAPLILGLGGPEMVPCDPGDKLTSWALGTVDCALWDLRGQAAGCPVADLLGPCRSAEPVRAYASCLTIQLTDPLATEAIARAAQDPWSFTKWAMRAEPGVSPERMAEALTRAAATAGQPVAVDALRTWEPTLYDTFARLADPAALVWLEDPLPGACSHWQRPFAEELPVAIGEHLALGEDLAALLGPTVPAALCVDVVGCGGLTRALAICRAAQEAGVPVYPHGRSLVPGTHLAAAFPGLIPAVEYRLRWEPARQELLAGPIRPDAGFVSPHQAAGLGTSPGGHHA
jgi:L-alanine-DL-glutamate epimerase-like enolase superfamily enzyme